MARLATAINNYQTNNNGDVPKPSLSPASEAGDMPTGSSDNDAIKLVTTYLNSVNANKNEFLDPDGWAYGVEIINLGTGSYEEPSFSEHKAYVYTQAECVGEKAEKTSNRRDYAIVYKMEGSGTYCKDSR